MSKWKNSNSWNRGQRIEKAFAPLLRQRDPNYRKANREEQFRHIDYFSNFGTIDVSPIVVYLGLWFIKSLLIEYWPR